MKFVAGGPEVPDAAVRRSECSLRAEEMLQPHAKERSACSVVLLEIMSSEKQVGQQVFFFYIQTCVIF